MRQLDSSTQQELKELTQQIVESYQPDRIILFGSFAEGKPHQWSDYDLFIIKNTREPFLERMRTAHEAIKHYPSRGVDILVYRPNELQEPNYFIEQVLAKGIKLYERPSLSKRNQPMA